jgi:anion-transporting  ArsA/GET3 family ATPase
MSTPTHRRVLDLGAMLANKKTKIVVTCGSGGVGKTTTAAAMALWAADSGRKVAVLTIDPAKRLAQSLGLDELDNDPRRVEVELACNGGELWAMMLDTRRTFDEMVANHSTPDRAAAILANPFYKVISTSFSGTQEYMAMEKLGQLHARDEWDLIVVDTPPSRSALDFLDAPQRLARFLDGRMLRLLLAPARAGGRSMFSLVTASFGLFAKAVQRLLGTQLLTDLSGFVAGLDSTFGGFRQRAEATYRVLQANETAFLVVAAPEPDAIREASYFAQRLAAEQMPLHGLVLNRVHRLDAPALSVRDSLAAAKVLDQATGDHQVTAEALRVHALLGRQVAGEAEVAGWFTMEHPKVPVVTVTAQAIDVHDLIGLREIGRELARGGD